MAAISGDLAEDDRNDIAVGARDRIRLGNPRIASLGANSVPAFDRTIAAWFYLFEARLPQAAIELSLSKNRWVPLLECQSMDLRMRSAAFL